MSDPPRHRAHERSCARLLSGGIALIAMTLFMSSAAPAAKPGDRAASFDLPRVDGSGNLSLESLRGKWVYLDFWATWCDPCLSAVPALENLRKEFPADQFQVLAVNLDKKVSKARKFMKRKNIGYPSVSDPKGRTPEQFGLETMPTSYLIDPKGVVRYVHKGFRKGDIEAIREEIARSLR
jgi:peroxiredoxin